MLGGAGRSGDRDKWQRQFAERDSGGRAWERAERYDFRARGLSRGQACADGEGMHRGSERQHAADRGHAYDNPARRVLGAPRQTYDSKADPYGYGMTRVRSSHGDDDALRFTAVRRDRLSSAS